jgi:uncharacterized sulfatase
VSLQTALSLLLLATNLCWAAGAAAADKRPNIVFVYTDDQAPWALGAAGNRDARTPTLDRLVGEGAYLINAFTTTPVCSPSRAGLLVSRFGTEVGITDWIDPRKEPNLGLDPSLITWPERLQRIGYVTGLFGKWHLGTRDEFHPRQNGYDEFFGFRAGGAATKDPVLEVDGTNKKVPGFAVEVLTDAAIDFVRRHRGRPFLVSVHFREPHAPWQPIPAVDWNPFKSLDPTIPNPDYPDLDIERAHQNMREYLGSVAAVDRNLGRLLAVLDELNLRDNTVVIFTSDHGYNIGHNGIVHKGNGHWLLKSVRDLKFLDPRRHRPNLYDNSLRVPTIVRWPGVIPPGSIIRETVTNLDWYPTILAMTGATAPDGQRIRGRNFLPLLRGKPIPWDNDLFVEYLQHHYVEADLRGYRTPEWKLVRDFRNQGKDELYHLARDPAETTNLIGSPAPQVASMRRVLEAKLTARMAELRGQQPRK